MEFLTQSSPGGLPSLSLTTNSSWLPWGRVAMPLGSTFYRHQLQMVNDFYKMLPIWSSTRKWSLPCFFVSETVTVSDNWFVFNVDSVYCTVCLCISDRVCSLLHTCSVCFVIIKNCFVIAASYLYFVGIRGSVTHFFRAWVTEPPAPLLSIFVSEANPMCTANSTVKERWRR